MPLSFPQNPTLNQTTSTGQRTWTWDGEGWMPIFDLGYAGSQGQSGFTGSNGYIGSQGLQGNTGYVGSVGYTGSFGYTGSQSYTGSIGYAGSAGTDATVPKITNIQITNNSYDVIDDTAVDTAGGYILITGTGFITGALVYFNQTPANSVAFVNATTLQVTVPALTAGTYIVYVINPDGGTAIRVPGLTASANPAWQTGSNLGEQSDGAISLSLVATDATSYTLVSGSLPPGLSLNTSTGAITGTVTGVTVETTYTFTVRATDAQLQDSPRTFTVTITVSDPYFKLTTLLLSGSALSANTVIRDSSTNNFNLTVFGDARASNFTPYGTGWSAYFDGTTDFVSTPTGQTNLTLGTSDFTIEGWFYIGTQVQTDPALFTSDPAIGLANTIMMQFGASNLRLALFVNNVHLTASSTNNYLLQNQWNHVAVCRTGGSTYSYYINGVAVNNVASNSTSLTTNAWRIGYWTVGGNAFAGNISNFRIIKGTAIYSGTTITVPTAPLTAVANTQLLILQSNSFIDSSSNNFTITRNGDVAIRSFNPFGITNTGVNGSMYFDGSGDYVQANGANLAVGTGDFTLECWVYTWVFSGDPGITQIGPSAFAVNTPAYTNSIGMSVTAGGNIFFYNNGTYTTGNVPIQAYTWNHLAICRSGTTHRLFVNGVQAASVTDSSNYTGQFFGAGVGYGTNYPFTGYITNTRLLKGTALYTAAFTPPTAPLTAIANTHLLVLQNKQPHNNHTFLDASSNQFLITRNGNTTQGTFSPFSQSGHSVYFDGSGDYLTVPDNAAFQFGTGDFTMELWVWVGTTLSTAGSVLALINKYIPGGGNESNQAWQWYIYNDAGVVKSLFQPRQPGSSEVASWSTAIPTYNTQWNHAAVVRSGNNLLQFWNGVLTATTSYTVGFNAATGASLFIGARQNDLIGPYNGYMSNIRIVKGTALYTSNFTPSTTPLTSVANTSLLTCQSNRFIDASTNNFTITRNGDTRVVAFSPFAPTAVYNPVTHGGSAYFDGTGDYLEMTYNPAFKFAASQDFCVEFWAYATSSLTANYILSQVTTNNWGFIFGVGSVTSGRMGVYYGNGATNSVQYLDDTAAFPLYQWIHVAWCRTSGTMSLFVDGTRRSTVANTNAINLTTDRGIRIGAHQDGAANTFWPGYIASLRSVVGNSPYNATLTTLTLPTTPVTTTANTSILLNFTDAAILDSTGRTVLETVADAKTSSVVTKFTGGSMYFDGTGDYLAIPANAFFNQNYSATNKFTIEFWFYQQSLAGAGTAATVISTYGGGGGTDGWRIETSANAPANSLRWVSNGSDTACSATVELNTWNHFAFTYNGTTIKVFKNGVLGNTATTSWTNNPGRLFIGTANAGLAFPITGYLSDLRITNAERYTATFTAPTAPYRLK